MANTPLEVFAYASPFGIGPVTELYLEGRVSMPYEDPRGYIAWGALGFVAQRAFFGTTKLAQYAPLVGEMFYGPTGLFRIFPSLGPAIGVAGIFGAITALSVAGSAAVVSSTEAVGGKPHLTSFTGMPSGKYFDYP